ncbi:MAG: Ig-like domain-containing protein [Roseovarius sp.]|uniref:Ig-like domain-containing protein n=1 Tax=Roseovarius sp. TaxID=1486281 RepID=UPI0032EB04F0
MKVIDFVTRTDAGISQRGSVSVGDGVTVIPATHGQEISLNLRQTEIAGYARDGSNLIINLADGRVVVLDGYFAEEGGAQSRLFISADGYLNEVTLIDGADGAVYAQYGPTEQWGKWSPDDDLIFLGGNEVVAAAADEEVSMLGAGLLAGGGLLGVGGAGAAGLAAAAAVGGGDSGGSGGRARIEPVVNEDGVVTVAGDDVDDPSISITGRAEPGSEVVVTIGDEEIATEADDQGDWEVTFEDDTFPGDGTHPVVVVVTEPDGTETTLAGPDVVIDLTPPDIAVEEGTQAVGHVVNLVDHEDGVEISGTGEPGAGILVVVDGVEAQTVVDDAGAWQVLFDPADLPGGEREAQVTITATDGFGNTTVVTDVVEIDTVPHPISINAGAVGGDGVVNFDEAAGGVEITGTSTAGATVIVTVDGVSREVVTGADGTWRAVYEAGSLPGGEYDATVSASTVDAAGNASQTSATVRIDTEVSDFDMQGNPGGADGVINAAEQGGGFGMTGQVEPGSSVVVEFAGSTVNAVVAADGSWTATFSGAQVPGGTYSADVVATATDAAGNISELRQAVAVDTEAGHLTLNAAAIGGDGVINAAEADAGVLVTGQADPGATVIVSLDGVEHSVRADQTGQWRSRYNSGEITRGVHEADVTARTVDAAGNETQVAGTVQVDTQVDNLSLEDLNLAIGADGRDVINNDVATGGFVVTGTIEAGSQVFVTIDGVRHEADVDGNGNWTASFGPNEIAPGERDADIRVDVTDPAGNTAFIEDTVRVDTFVNALDHAGPVTADNVVNIAEAGAGVTLTGQVEAGSSVQVEVFGRSYDAVVAPNGVWSVEVPGRDVPAQEGTVDMVVIATDWAGNTDRITESFAIDTVAPDTPGIVGYFRQGDGYRNATVETSEDEIAIHQVDAGGNVRELDLGVQENSFTGETDYFFLDGAGRPASVPDGSQLVVSGTDPGGNASSTYVVLDETNTQVVDVTNPNLAGFNIETIDLRFGDQADLTLTEAQLRGLSGNSDQVVVQGGADDQVTITGAQAAGQTQIDGQTFDVYTLGNDATVVVDEDINTIT